MATCRHDLATKLAPLFLTLCLVGMLALPACQRETPATAPPPAAPTTPPRTEAPPGPPPADARSAGELRVTFLDVGQGDSALVQAPGGQTMLIDAGDTDQGDTVIAALGERGISRLDWAVASHPHADHFGGFVDLLPKVPPARFLDSAYVTGAATQRKVLQGIRDAGARLQQARAGDAFDLGGARVEVVAPSPKWVQSLPEDNANNASVVLRVSYGQTKFLFTGDMEMAEREEIYRGPQAAWLEADVLKVSHHGSHNGTDAEFLQRVRPRFAVISCGKGNDYGHPHREAVQALEQARVQIYRTDRAGTVTATSDGTRLGWETKRSPAGGTPGPTPEAAAPARQVIGNRRTHVYHRPDCGRLPAASNREIFPSPRAAREAGYKPHPGCAP